MGQCAMTTAGPCGGISEKDGCQRLVDDAEEEYENSDLFSVAATPQTQSMLSLGKILRSPCNGGVEDESDGQDGVTLPTDTKKTFLKLHRPDIVQRCLIDPDEIERILSLQADVLLQAQHLQQAIGAGIKYDGHNQNPDLISTFLDKAILDEIATKSRFAPRSDAGESSLVSGTTGITTASRSTILAGNNTDTRNSKESNALLRKRQVFRKNDHNRTNNLRPKPSSATRLQSVEERDSELTSKGTDAVNNDSTSFSRQPRIAGCQSLLGHLVATTKQVNPCLDLDMADKRDQYMSVLRLTVKANLGRFYVKRYSTMFPDSLKLSTAQKSSKNTLVDASLPELTTLGSSDLSSSSDNSESYNGTYRTVSSDYVHYGNLPPSKPIKCSVTGETFLDLAITGSLGLLPNPVRSGKSWSNTSSFTRKDDRRKSPDEYICLINRRSGFPLAICALKAVPGPPVVRIYATRKRIFTQKPSATTQQLGLRWSGLQDAPLYSWAELACDGDFPDSMTVSMYMATGSEGRFGREPSYMATFSDTQFVIQMTGRTDLERQMTGCALISLCVDDGADGGGSFNIDISKGIDSALLICFTAIMDEILEKYMRDQCKHHAKKKISIAKRKSNANRRK